MISPSLKYFTQYSFKVTVQDVNVTKYVDKSSPNLTNTCCTGKHYPEVIITVRKAVDKSVEYLKITMTDVFVTSISAGRSGGATVETGFNIEENIAL